MRLKAALIILAVFSIGLVSFLLIDTQTISASRLETTRKVCTQCHMAVPEYGTASFLHVTKSSFNCSYCHGDNSMLKTTDSIHKGLQWLGVGMWSVVLAGAATSSILYYRRNGAQE